MSNAAESSSKLRLEKTTSLLALLFRRLVLSVKAINIGTGSGSHIAPIRSASTFLKILSSNFIQIIHEKESINRLVVPYSLQPHGL